MKTFKITDEMRKRVEENSEGLLDNDIENRRTYGIAFCDKFYRDLQGNFDTRGNFDGEVDLCYVGDVAGMTVIVDGSVRRDTTDEFLNLIKEFEDRLTYKNEKFLSLKNN